MQRLLLVTPTTGYQALGFLEAARRLQIDVAIASDRCHQLPDPWADGAIPIRFDRLAEAAGAILERLPAADAIIGCGDRAAVLAAAVAPALGARFHPLQAARLCHDKFAFKQMLAAAGLPAPWFTRVPLDAAPPPDLSFPCVLKPLMLSASRGVIRANNAAEFSRAFARIRLMLEGPEIRELRDPNSQWIQIEAFIPGREFALEGWIDRSPAPSNAGQADGSSGGAVSAGVKLQTLALFDKPDPLEGPFFEETLYVTPSRLDAAHQRGVESAVAEAARAAGLGPGPIHAEVRWHGEIPYVLEIAARPIGGLCARSLRFVQAADGAGTPAPLEELLLRAACGEAIAGWHREPEASGVMMIPIPCGTAAAPGGIDSPAEGAVFEEIAGVEQARAIPRIESVEITAVQGAPLAPLPEGSTYLGFIFARAATAAEVETALRRAHGCLKIHLRPRLRALG